MWNSSNVTKLANSASRRQRARHSQPGQLSPGRRFCSRQTHTADQIPGCIWHKRLLFADGGKSPVCRRGRFPCTSAEVAAPPHRNTALHCNQSRVRWLAISGHAQRHAAPTRGRFREVLCRELRPHYLARPNDATMKFAFWNSSTCRSRLSSDRTRTSISAAACAVA